MVRDFEILEKTFFYCLGKFCHLKHKIKSLITVFCAFCFFLFKSEVQMEHFLESIYFFLEFSLSIPKYLPKTLNRFEHSLQNADF